MYKKSILILLITASFLSISSCSKEGNSPVLQEKLTKENLYQIAQNIYNEKKLTRDQIDLFNSAINRYGLTPDSIIGKTVGELITKEEQNLWQNSAKQLVATLAKVQILSDHKIKYLGLQPQDKDTLKLDIIVFEITNTSNKDIQDLEGQFRFFDMQNQLIKAYPIQLSKVMTQVPVIKPGETRRFAYPFFHDSNNERDEKVRAGKDLQILWFPVSMTFSDSTKINTIVNN
ncbi:MAG TPA: hypothetical protein PKV40_02190 [Candidatus Kapabacteria bacterium]|nr:hypothetical protein [Candidatus Kapabacteria bacterium]